MTRKYFGTDGVRGTVGEDPITPEFVLRLGQAAGRVLARQAEGRAGRPSVLIGKDTRISGYMLEAALEAGFSSAGVDVVLSGPLPTPAVQWMIVSRRRLRQPCWRSSAARVSCAYMTSQPPATR